MENLAPRMMNILRGRFPNCSSSSGEPIPNPRHTNRRPERASGKFNVSGFVAAFFLFAFGPAAAFAATISMEILDPNPLFLAPNGTVFNSPGLLTAAAPAVTGAAADGVTQVLLRLTTSGPGTVIFGLNETGSLCFDCRFFNLGSSSYDRAVTSTVTQTSPGVYKAFALYLTPLDFDNGQSASVGSRNITIRASYTPVGAAATTLDTNFQLVRPPVVLLHGFWSTAATWKLPLLTDSRFLVTRWNYGPTNTASLATNKSVAGYAAADALQSMRSRGIAATQVDLIGHSMGGILARKWTNDPTYKRRTNFMTGDFHKLITIDSPHFGTPWGNEAQILTTGQLLQFAICGYPLSNAVVDLSEHSDAIAQLGSCTVPTHALAGIGGSSLSLGLTCLDALLIQVFEFVTGRTPNVALDLLFGGEPHDDAVRLSSQLGGISLVGQSPSFSGDDGVHTCETKSSVVSAQLVQLLQAIVYDPFSSLPAPSSVPSVGVVPFSFPGIRENASGGLSIISPADGSTAVPGSVVHVTLSSSASLTDLFLVGPGNLVTLSLGALAGDLPIPIDASGSIMISAFGHSSDGTFYSAPPVHIKVSLPSAPQSIRIDPESVFIDVGTSAHLEVIGAFSDGIERDLTDSSTGTRFSSSDETVATTDGGGTVHGVTSGTVSINAANGVATAHSVVTVNAPTPQAQCPAISFGGGPSFVTTEGATTDFQFTAEGGVPPYTLTISGSLPPGLEAHADDLLVDGAATIPGIYVLEASVADSYGCQVSKPVAITVEPARGTACEAGDQTGCLLTNRFELTLVATDPRTGGMGVGHAIPQKDNFMYFSFPSFTGGSTVPEVMVKIVDGRAISCCFWLFHTGLTDLQYYLSAYDTATGALKTYLNDRGDPGALCGAADTGFFGSAGPPSADNLTGFNISELEGLRAGPGEGGSISTAPHLETFPFGTISGETGSCVGGADGLCLLGHRFRVTLTAKDPRTGNTGTGSPIPQGDQFGYFSLPSFTGDPSFPEVFVKMVDGTAITCCYWVFHSGLTDLEYTMTIVDTVTGSSRTYHNSRESPAKLCGGADTAAFPSP